MKEVFMIALVSNNFNLVLLPIEYTTYGEAQAAIALQPPGIYQVQKFFKVA